MPTPLPHPLRRAARGALTLGAVLAALCGLGALACLSLWTPPAAQAQEVGRPWLGVGIERGRAGVRVTEVLPGSPCAGADIHPGDEIFMAGDQAVAQPAELIAAVQRSTLGAALPLKVRSPQGQEHQVRVTLGPRPNLREVQRDALLGKDAPDLRPQVLSGPRLPSLASLRGQVVLLDFFASWCGPCMAALPEIKALHQRYGARGLRVVGLSNEPEEAVAQVARDHALPYTVALDGDQRAWRAYWITALPTVVVIDRRGKVRLVTASDLEQAARAIEAALAEAPAPPRGAR